MDDKLATKQISCDLKDKLKIIKVFDEIINQVDIDAESTLLKISQIADLEQSIKEETEKEINHSRKFIIDKINEIKNLNLDNLNKTFNFSEQPFEDLLVKHCVYLDSITVRGFTFIDLVFYW